MIRSIFFIVALTFVAVPITEAAPSIPTFTELKKMPFKEQARVVTSLREALAKIEEGADSSLYTKDSRLQELLHTFRLVIMEDAYASEMANCVFAGYAQQTNSRGRCPKPKPVTDKCGSTQVECNPLLFGEGVCIDGPFAQATAKCQESPDALDPRAIAENLKGEEKQKAWDELRAQLLEYCKSPRAIDERACEVLAEKFAAHEEILAKIKAEEVERQAKEAAAKALEASMKYMYPKPTSAEYCETDNKTPSPHDDTNSAAPPVVTQTPTPSPVVAKPESSALPDCVEEKKKEFDIDEFWSFLKFWEPKEELDTSKMGCVPVEVAREKARKEFEEKAKTLTQGLTTEREKAFAIYEWIVKNIAYDYDGLNKDRDKRAKEPSFMPTTKTTAMTWMAEDVFRKGVGVCSGYSELLIEMSKAVGIKAEKVENGQVAVPLTDSYAYCSPHDPKKDKTKWCDHAWVQITLKDEGGKVVHAEPTWADARGNSPSHGGSQVVNPADLKKYFGITPENLESEWPDHRIKP